MSTIAPELEQIGNRTMSMSLCDMCEIAASECSLINGAVVYRLCLNCFKGVATELIWETPIGDVISFRRSFGREVIVEGSGAEKLADLMSCTDDEDEMSAGAV